ncbi:MAG: hypothetical protein KDA60_10100 [Planctomycetales bacterium]|nr:hypothetical protein [Planctomycetales bacterium]
MYVSSITGPYRGDSQTGTWENLQGPNGTWAHDDKRFLVFDLDGNLFETSDGGTYRLRNPSNDPAVGEIRRWELLGGIRTTEFISIAYDSVNNVLFGGTQDNGSTSQSTAGSHAWNGLHGGDGGFVAVEQSGGVTYRYSTGNHWQDFYRRVYDSNNNLITSAKLQLAAPTTPQSYLSGLTNEAAFKSPKVSYFPYVVNDQAEVTPGNPQPLLLGIASHVYESVDRGDTVQDISPGGFRIQQYASNDSVESLADVDALLTTTVAPAINFSDTPGGGQGHFSNDAAFPLGNDDDFVIHATGRISVSVPQAGLWTFGINSDDGARLLIDGRKVIEDDAIHSASDTLGTIELSSGQHEIELIYFDHLGDATVELFAASGDHASFGPQFDLVSTTGTGLRPTGGGFSVRQLVANTSILNLANAETVVRPTYVDSINFSGSGALGHYSADELYPLGDDDDFVLVATASFRVSSSQAGAWTFGVNSDDGTRLKVDGNIVLTDDSIHSTADTFGAVQLAAGNHQIELVAFDHVGGSAVELFAAPGNHTSFNSSFELLTSGKTSGLEVYTGLGSRTYSLDAGASNDGNAMYVGSVNFAAPVADPTIWIRRTVAGNPVFQRAETYPGGTPLNLVMDPNDWQRAYVLEQFSGKIWETVDGGASWREMSQDADGTRSLPKNLRTLEFVNIQGTQVLLVGGEGGVYRRIDPDSGANSQSWTKLGFGLPNAVVNDLVYDSQDDILFAGTFGRGVWRFSDASVFLPILSTLQINGDQEFQPPHDSIRLVANQNILDTRGDPMWLHVFVNSTGTVPNYSFEFATFDRLVINGKTGNDVVFVEDFPSHIPIEVNGGTGDDFIFVQLDDVSQDHRNAGELAINGGDGADWISVQASAVAPAFVNGGMPTSSTSPADTLNIVSGTVTPTITPGPNQGEGTIHVGNLETISYQGIESTVVNGPVYPPDRFEENDSRATAYDLVGGDQTQLRLNIDRQNDEDWFRWQASGTGTLIVEALFRHAQGNLDLSLHNASGNVLASSNSMTDDEYVIWEATAGAVYYFLVKGQSGAVHPDYSLEITWPYGLIPDSFEDNDTLTTAYDLGQGDQTHTGLTIEPIPGGEFESDDDWFRWTASSFGGLTVDLKFAHTLGNLDLELYNSSGSLMQFSRSTTDNESVTSSVVPGNQYYIRVYGQAGATHPNYDLIINGPHISVDALGAIDIPDAAADLGHGPITIPDLSIETPGGEDWFRWMPLESGTLNVDVTFSHALGDLDLAVYDGQLEPIAVSDTVTDVEHLAIAVEAEQTYFVRVYGFGEATNYDYQLELQWPHELPPDRLEPNDTREEAANLRGGDQQQLGLSVHREPGSEFVSSDDWYLWQAWQFGTLSVDVKFQHALGDLDVALYDADGEELARSDSTTNNEHLNFTVFSGQTYYVRVYGYLGATNPRYDLFIDGPELTRDIFEPNDNAAQAFHLGSGSQSYGNLTIHASENDDWYRWRAPAEGEFVVSVDFLHELGDLDLELYDLASNILAASTSTTDNEMVMSEVFAGQEFLIRIYGFSGITHRQYELEILGPSIPPDPYEPNDSLVGAYTLEHENGELGELTVDQPNDDDWYRWEAPAAGTLHVGLLFPHDAGDLDLELFSEGGVRLAESRSVTDNEALSWEAVAGQTYYIRVYGVPANYLVRRPLYGPPLNVFDGALQAGHVLYYHFEEYLPPIRGDLDEDRDVDAADIDLLYANLGTPEPFYDLNEDGSVNQGDVDELVREILSSQYGDANLDRQVDTLDFSLWNQNRFGAEAGWASADFDGNGLTDVRDFNLWNRYKFISLLPLSATPAGVPRAPLARALDVVAIDNWFALRERADDRCETLVPDSTWAEEGPASERAVVDGAPQSWRAKRLDRREFRLDRSGNEQRLLAPPHVRSPLQAELFRDD